MGLPCLRYGSVGQAQEVDKAWGPSDCQEEDFEDCIIDGISSLCQGGVSGGEKSLIRIESHNWALVMVSSTSNHPPC